MENQRYLHHFWRDKVWISELLEIHVTVPLIVEYSPFNCRTVPLIVEYSPFNCRTVPLIVEYSPFNCRTVPLIVE